VSEKSFNNSAGLVAVDIHSFRDATRDISFDVFMKLSEDNVVHVFSRTTGLDYKRLAQYTLRGVQQLYILPQDVDAYKAFIARPAHLVLEDPNTSNEKKIATILNMTEQNMAELFSQINVSEETASASQRVIHGYVDMMTKKPESLALLLKLVSHGEYLYYHSIAVSIFSMFIAKASGQFNTRMLEIVGLGGFLHDVGSVHVSKDLLDSPKSLEEDQKGELEEHPQHGLMMLEGNNVIPEEVRYIVYQHHEQPGGNGYPNAIHSPVIYYPAKIVALADSFSALISKRPYRAAYTVENAVEIMRKETVNGKFDRELMEIVATVFLRKVGANAA
jgi:HD-GYP domain-containing protein (c-di-GMP phosphodiesterase class II)